MRRHGIHRGRVDPDTGRARGSCRRGHALRRQLSQVVDPTPDDRRLTAGLSPALGVCVHPNQEVVMRKLFLTLVAGSVVAACGHQKSQSSEASAAEVSTTRSETSTVASPPASPVTVPVSFTDGQTAFT